MMGLRIISLMLTAVAVATVLSQCAWIPSGAVLTSEHRLNGTETLKAFRIAEHGLQQARVRLTDRRGQITGLGTIVRRDGLVVTKASEIDDAAASFAILPDGRRVAATYIGEDDSNDLSLLRLPITFHTVPSQMTHPPEEGDWVACLDNSGELRVGIVSGHARSIAKPSGVLGIVLAPNGSSPGALVQEVIKGSPANQARIHPGDQILAVDNLPVTEFEDLQEIVQSLSPHTPIRLAMMRDGARLDANAILGDETVFEGPDTNLKMSGKVSERRAGFREVFQHDSPLKPQSMGGPVTNLRGDLVGINVARRDRVTTYTLTNRELQHSIARMLASARN